MSQTDELEQTGAQTAAGDVIPSNVYCVGEIGPEDFRVYLHQDVYNALESYAKEGSGSDRGAILLGQYREEPGRLNVLVSGCVEAKYADVTGGALCFTQETWDYVQRVRTVKHPDKWIVGWEHSQPGRGLVLSDHDRQLHAEYFELPFQLVYLIDPEKKLRGFYRWQDGSLAELHGFYVYDEPGRPIKLKQGAEKTSRSASAGAAAAAGGGAAETQTISTTRSMLSVAVILALLIAVAALAISLAMRKNIQEQNTQLKAQSTRQAEIEAQLSGTEGGGGDVQTTLSEMMALLTEHQNTIERQQQTIEQLQSELGQGSSGGTTPTTPTPTPTPGTTTTDDSPYLTYTVKQGDTLYRICNYLGVSYLDHKDEILQLNNITNENYITVGATYRFPKP